MKKTINFYDFEEEFMVMRLYEFSHKGLQALYDYLLDLESEIGEIELDVIGLRCEYTEYENIEQFNKEYDKEYNNYREIQETIVIPVDEEKFIIQNF